MTTSSLNRSSPCLGIWPTGVEGLPVALIRTERGIAQAIAICVYTVLALLAGCTSTDQAARPSEVDVLRRQIASCWTPPVGVVFPDDMVVSLRIQVRPDRTVQSITIEDAARLGSDPTFRAVAESARWAVAKCSPLDLPPGKYAVWRNINLNFIPRAQ